MRWRVFIGWCLGLSAFWVFANWPQRIGKGIFEVAGFPLNYAVWLFGKLEKFDTWALTINCLFGAVVVIGLSWLCAWSRKRR